MLGLMLCMIKYWNSLSVPLQKINTSTLSSSTKEIKWNVTVVHRQTTVGYCVLIEKPFVLCIYIRIIIRTEKLKGRRLICEILPSLWIPVQFNTIPAHSSFNTNLNGQWKPMVHCVNVISFLPCNTDGVKTTDLTLIVKVTLCWPVRLLAFSTLHQSSWQKHSLC